MTGNGKAVLAAIMAISPVAAAAQQSGGAVTLGYGYSDISNGGGDASSLSFDAAGSIDFGNNLALGLYGSFTRVDPDDGNDIDLGEIGAKLVYKFQNRVIVGGYLEHANLDLGSGVGDVDATSYGLIAGYAMDRFRLEAFFGESDTSPDLGSGMDWTDYGAMVTYDVSPTARIGGHLMRSDISINGIPDIEVDSFGIGGDVQLGAGWGLFGGLSYADVGLINSDVTTIGVGVSYDLRQVTSIPAALSLELARSEVDTPIGDVDADTIRLGLTFPLGAQGRATPLNSVGQNSFAPRHNSVTTLLNMDF